MRTALFALLAAATLLGACQQGAARAEPGPVTPPPTSEPAPQTKRTAATGEMCGGIAGIACRAEGDYCKHPDGQCRVADGSGTCTPKTPMCTRIYQPVCGCDGKTYGNPCEAGAAGTSVDHVGECAKPPE